MLNIKMFKINEQKGISLFFVTVMVSVVLAAGLGISTIIINQTRMIAEIGYSVAAFYAADSGIEKRLYDLYIVGSPHEPESQENMNGDGDLYFRDSLYCGNNLPDEKCPLNLSKSEDCLALNFCLKSIGNYKGVERAIEINY